MKSSGSGLGKVAGSCDTKWLAAVTPSGWQL